jgi:hypothetical protein
MSQMRRMQEQDAAERVREAHEGTPHRREQPALGAVA